METTIKLPSSPNWVFFDNTNLGFFGLLILPAFFSFVIAVRWPEDNGIWWQNYETLMTFGFVLLAISMTSFIILLKRLFHSRSKYNSFKNSFSPVHVNIGELPDWQQKESWAHIQTWLNENVPNDKMIYKDDYLQQCMFVRDKFTALFNAKSVEVVSTHVSKSITLPVYHIELNDGIHLIMRYNFHDWKVTVVSDKPIFFQGMEKEIFGSQKERISIHYCEGFKEEWIFDNYNPDNNFKRFTVTIPMGYHYLFTFLLLLKYQLNPEK